MQSLLPPKAMPVARRPGVPIRTFKLESITQPLKALECEAYAISAFRRILALESTSHLTISIFLHTMCCYFYLKFYLFSLPFFLESTMLGSVSPARIKLVVSLATQFGGPLKDGTL